MDGQRLVGRKSDRLLDGLPRSMEQVWLKILELARVEDVPDPQPSRDQALADEMVTVTHERVGLAAEEADPRVPGLLEDPG